MSYQIKIDRKSSNAGRFIGRAHREVQNAFAESGLKQYELAEILECNKSHVNRVLTGKENLTLRTLADFAWGLGYMPKVTLVKKSGSGGANIRHTDLIEDNSSPVVSSSTSSSVQTSMTSTTSTSTRVSELVDA